MGREDRLKELQEKVEFVGQAFTHPEDDWMPVGFAYFPEGDGRDPLALGLDPDFFGSEAGKDSLVAGLRQVFADEGVETFLLVHSAWISELSSTAANMQGPGHASEYGLEDHQRPSQMPDRKEIVIVVGIDGDGVSASRAEILRRDDAPPTLGDWSDIADGYSGRFVDPFLDTLKANKRRREEAQ